MQGFRRKGANTRRTKVGMLLRLVLPDYFLRVFPPNFVLRDPVTALVSKSRRQGQHIVLMLFQLRNYSTVLNNKPAYLRDHLQHQIRTLFLEVLSTFTEPQDLVGVKQLDSHDIAVFIRIPNQAAFKQCRVTAGDIMMELEGRLTSSNIGLPEGLLKVHSGCSFLDSQVDTETALEAAYHSAMADAAKELPASFAAQHIEMQSILETESVHVLTQPIMDLHTGEVSGWEILARGPLHSPLYSPVQLFTFAEQVGSLAELEWLVIRKALREIADRGIKEQVFINITPVSLANRELLGRLLEQCRSLELRTAQIVFEITERHSIEDFGAMASILRCYRAEGFRFAIDDAGSGYSSLQSISELIPDIIKIDKSVIRNIDRENIKQALLRSLLYFAENINCSVIAEGVEREEEASVLLQNKVHMGQGYYFAKPEPHENGNNVIHFESLKARIKHMQQVAAQ